LRLVNHYTKGLALSVSFRSYSLGGRGSQFDPALIDVFESIAGEFERLFDANED
jgi:hypothetical protein